MVLLIAGAVAFASMQRFSSDAAWVSHTHEVIAQAELVMRQTLDLQSGQRGFVLTGNSAMLDPYEKARGGVIESFRQLQNLCSDNSEQQHRLTALEKLVGARLAHDARVVALRRDDGFEAARGAIIGGEGERLMMEMRNALGEVIQHEQGLLSERGRNQRRSARSALAAMAALGGAAFGILGFTAFRVREELQRRTVAQQVAENLNAELKHRASELASEVEVRVAAEEEVRKRNDDLKAFAYTVSHDLKAPLRGITGYAQELERLHQTGLAERGRFCVAQIITASRNLDSLIDDLLKYARLDAEPVRETDLRLPDVVDSVLRDRRQTIAEIGAQVSVEVPPIAVHTWERGMRQALANLIDNALKYSRGSQPPRVWIRAAASEQGLTVSVADNGIGFDMKYHDRIFGLFNRLVRASEFEGTGAGLAIVRKVLERMGGAVRAESAPGRGATFTIRLEKGVVA